MQAFSADKVQAGAVDKTEIETGEPVGPEMQRWGRLPEGVLRALASRNGALLAVSHGNPQEGAQAAQKLAAASTRGYASGPGGINGAHSASPHEMGLGGHETAGPDATRGYDIQEYGKIWQALAQEKQWPSVQRFSVIGPSGAEFLETVKGVVSSTTGGEPEKIEVVTKTRFQSVRLDVRCASPDDFCLLHSRLKSIPKARFLL